MKLLFCIGALLIIFAHGFAAFTDLCRLTAAASCAMLWIQSFYILSGGFSL